MATPDQLEVPEDQPETDERCRSIERGALVVTVMPSIFAVVLQMPRGNLETIYPRALVLAGIRDRVDNKLYKRAFLACRKQKVDLNILFDHNPNQFLANIETIVVQLGKVEYIDLFLSQLRDEDVTKTLYRDSKIKSTPKQADATMIDNGNKVNRICDSFLTVLEKHHATNLQNVITANVCKSPPDIDAGLLVIAGLILEKSDLVDTAVEHICFLADVNRVYDHALGIYNLDLALLVAQQSQKDPREYLPYMQELQEMPTVRRQFKINDDLGRRGKALQKLHELDFLDEVIAYSAKHNLYLQALDLYRYNEAPRRKILRDYANALFAHNQYHSAAQAYESLSLYPEARDAYFADNDWQACLACAALVPSASPDSISALAAALSTALIEVKAYSAAATIALDHLHDIPSAVSLRCRAHDFATAIRLVSLHGPVSLLTEAVDPAIAEASSTLTSFFAECRAQLTAQVPRILELRTLKMQDPLRWSGGGGGDDDDKNDAPDDISLAGTTTTAGGNTLFTRYTSAGQNSSTAGSSATRQTSKNRRREERKRARGKKGSVYEEEYLVNSVGRLVERVNATLEEARTVVEACVRRNMWERGRAVDAAANEVVERCKGALGEVFGAGLVSHGPGGAEAGSRGIGGGGTGGERGDGRTERPPGAQGVLWDAMHGVEGAGVKLEVPVVTAYERHALL